MATMLDLALKVSLLMIVSGAIIALMRRTSAASRHVALTAALGAAVLLPAARWTLPALPLFVLTADSQPASAVVSPAETSAPLTAPVLSADPNTTGMVDPQVADTPFLESVRASDPAWSWPRVLGILWVLGTATIFLGMTVAGIRLRTLARDAQPIDDVRVTARLLEIKKHFGVRRPIALVVSAREWMPMTWGLWRPTILLPSSAATWIDTHPARLDGVLVHEMAHIARWDAAWQRIARVAVALFWFNPLVWIARRRARLERERACDDAVLARGLRATDYANDLLMLAQTLVLPPRAAGSALAMARRSQLEQRVGALLDDRVSRRRASRVSRLLAIALVVLMLPMSAAKLAARPLAPPEPSVISDDVPAREPKFPLLVPLQPQPVVGPPKSRRVLRAPGVDGPLVTANEAPQAVESPKQTTPLMSQPAKWKLERDAMFRLLIERARTLVKNGRTKIEIGTAAPIDMKPLEDTLALVERAAVAAANNGCAGPDPFARLGGGTCRNGSWTAGATISFVAVNLPTDAEIAAVKTRFTEALRNLDAAEVRLDNGLLTNEDIAAVVRTALKVLTEGMGDAPVPVRYVSGSGTNTIGTPADHLFTAVNSPGSTAADRNSAQALYALLTGRVSSVSAPLTDAELLEVLKGAASVKSDVERANTLLELSAHYAFTPEMVTLYVAAAKGISSGAQQIRVFAQPIRVK